MRKTFTFFLLFFCSTVLFAQGRGLIVKSTRNYAYIDGYKYLLQSCGTIPDLDVDDPLWEEYEKLTKLYSNSAILCAPSYGQSIGSYGAGIVGKVIVPQVINSGGENYLVQELDFAFNRCTNLTEIELPNSIIDINAAFYNCVSLKSIKIPPLVTMLYGGTFDNCFSLTTVIFPKSLKRMQGSEGVFENCNNILTVYSPNPIPPQCRDIDFTTKCYKKATLYVPDSSIGAYSSATGWKNFDNVRPISEYSAIKNISTSPDLHQNFDFLQDIEIYDLKGQRVYQGLKSEFQENKGFYIIQQGSLRDKILIR